MKSASSHETRLGGRRIEYRILRSRAARKLRLRVGPDGVEVVQPADRDGAHVAAFLGRNEAWILDQLKRVARLHGVRRRPALRPAGQILFRGEPTKVRVETTVGRSNATWP